jgi:membrane-associated two-gene conflict system component 1 (EACC1)
MAAFTVEITGEYSDQLARELQDSLTTHHGHVQIDAETERDPLTAVATIVSVVLAGVQAADIISKWWHKRRDSAHSVTIRTASGRVIELANVDHKHLEQILEEDE